jgi:hypothetical protein
MFGGTSSLQLMHIISFLPPSDFDQAIQMQTLHRAFLQAPSAVARGQGHRQHGVPVASWRRERVVWGLGACSPTIGPRQMMGDDGSGSSSRGRRDCGTRGWWHPALNLQLPWSKKMYSVYVSMNRTAAFSDNGFARPRRASVWGTKADARSRCRW